jgi:hypothetical protein
VLGQGVVFLDESVAVQAKTGLSLKIDEQQTDMRVD